MSLWKTLGKIGSFAAAPFTGGASLSAIPVIDAIGGGASSAADSMASNRGTQIDIEFEKLREKRQQEQDFFDAILRREQERRAAGNDAWKKLQQASYISNWAPRPGPNVSPYTKPLVAPANDIVAMARTPEMWAELSKRAAYQDPYGGEMPTRAPDFTGVDKRRDPGFWEKLVGVAGAAAPIISSVATATRKGK